MAKRSGTKGFTLIELLVVVAIIAALIAILIPSLSRARKRARLVQCLANSRGLSHTLQLYVADWGGSIPFHGNRLFSWPVFFVSTSWPNTGSMASSQFGVFIGPSVNYGVPRKMLLCPEASVPRYAYGTSVLGPWIGSATMAWSNSLDEIGLDGVIGPTTGMMGSYGLNAFLYNNFSSAGLPEDPPASFQQALAVIGISPNRCIRLPASSGDADIPAFADCNYYHVSPSPNDAPGPNLTDPGPLGVGVSSAVGTTFDFAQPSNPMSRVVMARHDRAINVSFLDGHATTVQLKDLWSLKWSADWKARPASDIVLPPR